MGQVLSQSEIESLLAGLHLTTAQQAAEKLNQPQSAAEIRVYDFERPSPLRPTELDRLRLACAAVTQSLQTGLTGLFRSQAMVEFLGVEQSTYRDYLATAETPACLVVYESTTPQGVWLLDLSRSLALTMIDCLLGGDPLAPPPAAALSRPFTELESRLIDKAVRTVLPELTGSVFDDIALRLTRVISDGSLVTQSQSNEAVALISYEIVCGQNRGLMQLCVPWTHVAHDSRTLPADIEQLKQMIRAGAGKVPVTATARVTRLKLSARDLGNLCPGDVLLTDATANSEMSLEVGGREIFRGTAGQIEDRRVLHLTTAMTSDRPDSAPGSGV